MRNMFLRKSFYKMLGLSCAAAFMLTACGQKEPDETVRDTLVESGMPGENGGMPQGPPPGTPPGGNQTAELVPLEDLERLDTTEMFSERDKDSTYDEDAAITITLNGDVVSCDADTVEINGSAVTITDEGTYILSGTLNNGSIIVEAEDSDKVQLVLDGVDITCATSAAIYVKEADKVFVTMADNTENKLTVTEEFAANDDNDVDGVIFSKADLTLNGLGALKVETSHGHGIVSKDDLVIADGNYEIIVSEKALSGKDSVRIANGNFVLNAGDDGIYSEHDEDYTKGFVYIENGNYTITAVNDGIHAGAQNVIVNGNITIAECEEGIEGASVDIRGGNIVLTSTDDGINASIPDEFETMADKISCYICISGGNVDVTAYGDGLDANGNLYIYGGTTYVSGPESSDNGSIDYDGTGQITGGIVVAAGFGGMAQSFGAASTQGAFTVNLSETKEAGTPIQLKDTAGKELISFSPKTSYNCVTISCPELKVGETYTMITDGESQEIEMTGLIQGGGMHGRRPQRPEEL